MECTTVCEETEERPKLKNVSPRITPKPNRESQQEEKRMMNAECLGTYNYQWRKTNDLLLEKIKERFIVMVCLWRRRI
jgi:hypothetical protein